MNEQHLQGMLKKKGVEMSNNDTSQCLKECATRTDHALDI